MSKQYFVTVDEDGTISYPPELTDFMRGKFFNENRITRLEVIDHREKLTGTDRGGRQVIFDHYEDKPKIEFSFQDMDRTLKIFVSDS